MLKLRLLNANGLLKKDIFGMSDPYAVINLTDLDNPNLEGKSVQMFTIFYQ